MGLPASGSQSILTTASRIRSRFQLRSACIMGSKSKRVFQILDDPPYLFPGMRFVGRVFAGCKPFDWVRNVGNERDGQGGGSYCGVKEFAKHGFKLVPGVGCPGVREGAGRIPLARRNWSRRQGGDDGFALGREEENENARGDFAHSGMGTPAESIRCVRPKRFFFHGSGSKKSLKRANTSILQAVAEPVSSVQVVQDRPPTGSVELPVFNRLTRRRFAHREFSHVFHPLLNCPK